MSEETWTKIRALGIPDVDMMSALKLARTFMADAARMSLDPWAVRIAIVFLDRSHLHFGRRQISNEMLKRLEGLGEELYEYMAAREDSSWR